MKHRIVVMYVACLLASTGLASRAVHAHAIVVEATPAANATVGNSVPVDLKFNSRIDTTRSRLAIVDATGKSRVLHLNPDSPPNHMRATASNLAPGKYRLEWYVLSADGHITRGNLKFHVEATP
ncbi:MAG: copper resistance protein CopC [Gammaproteobacteria bacterium]|nr:copper resistance protein CopC [Gammaproteobacteria bacterium]